ETGGVRYQDHVLRVVEDAQIEVALALKLRLEFLDLAHVKDHSAILDDLACVVANCEGVHHGGHEGAVFAADWYSCVGMSMASSSSLLAYPSMLTNASLTSRKRPSGVEKKTPSCTLS